MYKPSTSGMVGLPVLEWVCHVQLALIRKRNRSSDTNWTVYWLLSHLATSSSTLGALAVSASKSNFSSPLYQPAKVWFSLEGAAGSVNFLPRSMVWVEMLSPFAGKRTFQRGADEMIFQYVAVSALGNVVPLRLGTGIGYSHQARTVSKSIVSNGSDRDWNVNRGQLRAAEKKSP